MISGHGTNPIFFNKNCKDWMSRMLATPHPLRLITSHFYLTSHFKVEVICVSPLKMQHKFLIKLGTCYNRLLESK